MGIFDLFKKRTSVSKPAPTTAAELTATKPLPSTPASSTSATSAFKKNFLDVYNIGRVLGKGSFATVKEVERKADGKKFAVKIIERASMKGKENAIKGEIAVLRNMHHPNIIGLQDLYETDKQLFIVTDLATGGELFDKIVEKGSYTEKDAATIVKQILEGIAYIHDMDIVHRDLKPENLLLLNEKEDSPVKITDFGLSKVAISDDFLQTACGTPGYVAPEVLRKTGHGKPVDIWALGVITYVLLCGYTPFWGDTQTELLQSILEGAYEFEDDPWSNISQAAKDFIASMLILDSHVRPTARELLNNPWLETTSDVDLLEHVKKNFNAKRKLKMAVHLVQLAKKNTLTSFSSSAKKIAETSATSLSNTASSSLLPSGKQTAEPV
ncbi:kinase-like domain-containing protein [Chytridium lagenaria]|nr:kinase-like domain-containing protein [Chytridium lagenaria]